jgi:hypothetical protein
MEHQVTLARVMRVPMGSTTQEEGAMSAVVGIDVGAHKHVAAVCGEGGLGAERKVFRFSTNQAGFRQLETGLAARDR